MGKRNISMSRTLVLSHEVAQKALSLVRPLATLKHQDIDGGEVSSDGTREVNVSGLIEQTNENVYITITWPEEGINGHGSVFLSFEKDEEAPGWRFACWQNEDGSAGIVPWTTPSKAHMLHMEHGLKWPRNHLPRGINFLAFVSVGFLVSVFVPLIVSILLTSSLLSIVDIVFGFEVGGLITGGVFGFFCGLGVALITPWLVRIERVSAWESDRESWG